MKKAVIIVALALLLFSISTLADIYTVDQPVPFCVIRPVDQTGAPVFHKASTKAQIDTLPQGTICQIQAAQRISGLSWFKVRYFNAEGMESAGYIVSDSCVQMTLADLIATMSDPVVAAYMQRFVGFVLMADDDAELMPGSRSAVSDESITPLPTPAPSPTIPTVTYILNTSSRRFHFPDCPSVNDIKAKNKQEYTGTRQDAINMGYKPCGRCNP